MQNTKLKLDTAKLLGFRLSPAGTCTRMGAKVGGKGGGGGGGGPEA